jgi:integrase
MKLIELKPLRFGSIYSDIFTEYVKMNRSIGKKFITDTVYLEQFDTWCRANEVINHVLSRNDYDKWCEKRPNEQASTHHVRVSRLNSAVNYMRDNGRCNFTPHPALRKVRSFVPYIFTRDELTRFFDTADNIILKNQAPLAYRIYPLMFKMIYCCGLRKSEAINLRPRHVDLKNGILTILETKHNKDRLVPMSDSLTQLCRDYAAEVLPEGSAYFFPAPDSGHLHVGTVYTRFRDLLWKAGIPHGGRCKGPRVHDFRHSFAVHRLAE